jgi:prolyl oligopeptidase
MTQLRPPYPPAPKADVVDTYHGVRVADPYRWLEDPDHPDTIAWVEAQNALTRSVLDGAVRDALVTRLAALYDFPRAGVPFKRANRYFYTRNSGLQKQPVLYVQEGPGGEPRVLLDPNALDPDGTIAMTAAAVNDSGTLIAYGLSKSGSDIQELTVRDVESGRDLPDRIQWVKFASIAWVHDSTGFYYTRFPQPGTVPSGDENYFNQVYYHRLGDPQERDTLILDDPGRRETVFAVDVTDDDRWAVITAFQGSSDKSEVFLLDRQAPHAGPVPLFTGFTSAYGFIDASGERLFFQTDHGAPRGRIIAVDPVSGSSLEVVPETSDKLSSATIVHRRLIASYLENASDRIRMFDLAGTPVGDIPLPGIGTITGITGRPSDDELFFGFMSFTHPPASYRHEFESRTTTPFAEARSPIDPSQYETTQVWYPSKDGTRVSMFLVHRKDLPRDGQRPVLMTGYGGFNISLTPGFDPSNFAWLDSGGVYAVANLRGGGEYGEGWHQAGMFERKQNVFDDFIAAAEWLAAGGYTHARKIAIEGGSNGGLLTGAVMVQRPDLFGAVVCRVPVSDMLRYHLFTVGRFWISEYGSADDPQQFEYLYAYSPLHNVKDGVAYPPILITTADTDDRVSPGMAKKFAARLQEADSDESPVLIRVETRAGHGAGKPVSKVIEEDADIFAFLFKYLEVE